MSSAADHVLERIALSPIQEAPFPYIYVTDVFPGDFYKRLRAHWPQGDTLVRLDALGRVPKGAYPERYVMPLSPAEISKLPQASREFWAETASWLLSEQFMQAVMRKFDRYIVQRFGATLPKQGFSAESLVVRDMTNYKIGPHTDSPRRLLSLLFYCPDDTRYSHMGTSIYKPKEAGFRCAGGPHYPHDRFDRVETMPYVPNSLFAFLKTDHSFHGVEPITEENVRRDVLLYDIRVESETAAENPSFGIGFKILRGIFGAKNV